MPNTNTLAAHRVELLTWRPPAAPPDDDTTVLLDHAPGEATEPTWPGFLQSDTGRWHSADGHTMPGPSYWAHMPTGISGQRADDQTAAENLKKVACDLVAHAAAVGLVLTIEQVSVPPLAQGRHRTVVSVREVR